MTVTVTLEMKDRSTLDLVYDLFNYEHSKLWFKSLKDSCDLKIPLVDTDRVYNFNPLTESCINSISNCNKVIENINSQLQDIQIPFVTEEYLQEDVNYIHTHFVDSDRSVEYTKTCDPLLWSALNAHLHGLEAIARRKNFKEPQGQIFIEIPYREQYDLPDNSYEYFTVKKTFGYCYANYPHVGRHIYEMFQSEDNNIDNEHIVPMHQIAGSLHLWFGKTTSDIVTNKRLESIEYWFKKNNIKNKIKMEWGDPKLAIGWLPVAKLKNDVTISQLKNVNKVVKINIP